MALSTNHAWRPLRHNCLSETSGIPWIQAGDLTNQRCSLATGVGLIAKVLGKFDRVFRHGFLFLCVQFWIRLAAIHYRNKNVRTVASSAVQSVNKSLDTRNWVQNEPEYETCVRFTTHLYYNALGIILCALIWQIHYNYNRLDNGYCEVTGHRKMPALGTAGALETTHENYEMIWLFKGLILLSVP